MRALIRSAALLLVLSSTAFAQGTRIGEDPVDVPHGDRDAGIFSNLLLLMPVSPRAVALGEAMGAVEGDPSAIWYNTAGIARIRANSFMITGSRRFANTQLAGAAVTFPTAIGTFGVAARAFNAGTIEITENSEVFGRARAYQFTLEGGGAIQLAPWWLWGGTLFYAQETLADDSRGSIGVNSSMIFPDVFGRLTLGGGIRNWGTPVTFNEQSARPPMYTYVAAALDLLRHRNLLESPSLFRGEPIVLDAKAVFQSDFPYKQEAFLLKGGVEATLNGVIIGRVGYQAGDDNQQGLSLGAGINVGQFRLEYAFRDRRNIGTSFFAEDPLGDEHHVAATYFWGGQQGNVPVVPVIVTQPIDTAALNAAIRETIDRELAQIRPVLDSLRAMQVEITQPTDLVARYVVPVHFGFDSALVREEDLAVLSQVAEVIRTVYPTALITVEGFADPAGGVQYNLDLSRRRAEAVARVMVERFGLPERQFRVVGYGEQQVRQVVPGAERDDPGAQRNRRVTFTIDATQRF